MPRKAYASVATPRLYEEIPDRNQQAVMSAIYTGRNIANSILMASITGSASAARSMERYSRSESFFYGAPLVFTSLDNVEATEIWLRFLADTYPLGTDEFFRVTQVGTVEPGDRRRIDVHGYLLLQANPIASPDTFSRFEYVGAVARVFKNTGAGEVLHIEEESPIVTGGIEHYVFWAKFGPDQDNDDVPDLLFEGAEVYNESTDTMPELHDVGEPPPPLAGEMLPLVPIRINGVDYDGDGNGLEGSSSIRNMLRRADLHPDDLVEALKSNADEDKIDDAYVGFGISMEEDEDWAIAGLAATFSSWYDSNPDTETYFADTNIRQNINIGVETEGGLNVILTYNFIRKTVLVGEPGYTKTFVEGTTTEACFPADVPGDPPVCSNTASTNEYIITRPLKGDASRYEEIVISGLVLLHNVYVEELDLDRAVAIVDDVPEMVVPLFKNIIFDVPNKFREDLVFGSMRLFIYAIEIVHLSWYETGIFKAILFVVSVILAFFTYGASLIATLGITAATALLVIVAVMLVINYAVQWLAEEIGGTLAAILIIVATIYFGGGIDLSSLTVTLNNSWYSIYTAAVRVYNGYTSDKLDDIAQQSAEFEEDYEKRMLELEAAREALQYGEILELTDIIDSRSLPNTDASESPQEFYDRTSTTVDLAAISSSLVDDYYEAQVALPKTDPYLPSQQI